MASRNQYRKQYARYHKSYEKRALKELRRTFKKWSKNIDFDSLTEVNYETKIKEAINIEEMQSTYLDIYRSIGLVHGERVGKAINLELKAFSLGAFLSAFERNVAKYLFEFGFTRITSIADTFFDDLKELFSTRLEEQTMQQTAKEVQKIVNKPTFYRWQAQRIARTESTAASNYAAIQVGEVSGFEMVKEWISTIDKRTRTKPEDSFDHLEMDGKQVGLKEQFVLVGKTETDRLYYPGDPQGSASDVINCRCAVAVRPKRNSNGRLIPTN